jgi:hypothetical protein
MALARDEDQYVRGSVAKSPHTPPEVLVKMAWDKDTDVRVSVGENPNTPPEVWDAEDDEDDDSLHM